MSKSIGDIIKEYRQEVKEAIAKFYGLESSLDVGVGQIEGQTSKGYHVDGHLVLSIDYRIIKSFIEWDIDCSKELADYLISQKIIKTKKEAKKVK